MPKPLVAIVGRPNVGKSTLFNKLVGKRIAIVEDRPGVTRDRIYSEVEWLNNKFILIDTGGLEPSNKEELFLKVKKQVEIAIDMAHLIIFLVDGKEGLNPIDREIANILRKTDKKILLVCNKVDNKKDMDMIYDFYGLGFDEIIPISAALGLGIGDLLDKIIENLPQTLEDGYEDDVIKIAVIGRPNVGKSSLVNKILGEERVIVSDIPGTTRDAIDTYFEKEDNKYVLIDTAGLRRKSKIYDDIEKYSVIRALTAIDRSDVCLVIIDAKEGVTEQDKRIAGYALEQKKAIIILVNKWDLIEKDNNTYNEFLKNIRLELDFIDFAPVIFISAKTGQRVNRVLESVNNVYFEYSKRISTGLLNDVINQSILLNPPPSGLKIYYITQIDIKPPTFTIFVDDPEKLHFSYMRFLENEIRKSFGFDGAPFKFIIRKKTD